MEVTELVEFKTTDKNNDLVEINENKIVGLKAGETDIVANLYNNNTIMLSDHLIITNTPVRITSLSVAAVTDVNLMNKNINNTNIINKNNSITIDLLNKNDLSLVYQINQNLYHFYDKANISVYLNFEDGHYMDITNIANITSNSDMINIINDGYGPQLQINSLAPYGKSFGEFITANYLAYNDNNNKCELISGNGTIHMDIKTPSPTYYPTLIPTITSSPTSEIDLRINFNLIHPEIILSNGFAIPDPNLTSIIETTDLNAKYSRPFTALFGNIPGDSGSFKIKLGSVIYPLVSTFTTNKNIVSYLYGILKTNLIYYSRNTIAISYQVRDKYGSSQPSLIDLSIEMNLMITGQNQIIICSSPNLQTGLGLCTGTISLSWFSTTSSVTLTIILVAKQIGMIGGKLTSNILNAVLVQKMTYNNLLTHDIGMIMSYDSAPKFQGTKFITTITANTDINALHAWGITITYNKTILTYVSAKTSSLFVPAIITSPSSTTIKISTNSINNGIKDIDVTGNSIPIITITWQINSYADAITNNGIHYNAINLYVNQMVQSSSLKLILDTINDEQITSEYGQINGEIMTNSLTPKDLLIYGQITVKSISYVGIFAYTLKNELINSAWISNTIIKQSIIIKGITNKADVSDVIITTNLNCTLQNQNDFTIMDVYPTSHGCEVALTKNHYNGSSDVYIDVSYNKLLNTSISFIIWAYMNFELTADDYILNLIT